MRFPKKMIFHILIIYPDSEGWEEILVNADSYRQAGKVLDDLSDEPSSVRIRALDVVNHPDDFPVEILIKKEDMR